MAVSGHVDFNNKGWEENVHTQLVHTNETAPMLMLVCPKTVKRIAEGGDVQAVPNEYAFTIKGDDAGACVKDWGKGVVPHADAAARDGVVEYEGQFVENHVIRCSCVGNQKMCKAGACWR
jgi:hypothetical protein